jgi:hypothetical protein
MANSVASLVNLCCSQSPTHGRSNVSYGSPTLQTFPGLTPAHSLYSTPTSSLFLPLSSSALTVPARQHRNLTTLSRFAYAAEAVDSMLVTDCTSATSDLPRLSTLLSASFPGVANLSDAVLANNGSALAARGFSRSDGSYVDYRGGGLFFLRDPTPNLFNPSGACTVWREPLVHVGTDDHWVAFTGLNFAAGFEDPARANTRLVIDGVVMPETMIKVRDHELIEVLLPAHVGRRRIQVDVDSIRTTGIIVVNGRPLVHGFMEWRLGVEDVRGRSPTSENTFSTSILDGDAGWGGYGAWEPANKCMKVELIGFHYGGQNDYDARRLAVTTTDRPCELLLEPRHTRLTCCSRYYNTTITVFVGGQTSEAISFVPTMLVRKPVVEVRLLPSSGCDSSPLFP